MPRLPPGGLQDRKPPLVPSRPPVEGLVGLEDTVHFLVCRGQGHYISVHQKAVFVNYF